MGWGVTEDLFLTRLPRTHWVCVAVDVVTEDLFFPRSGGGGGVLRPYSYPDPRRISMDRNHTHKVIRTNETVKFKQSMKLSPLNLLLESNSFCHKVKGQGHISTCYLL